jgi:zinc protease
MNKMKYIFIFCLAFSFIINLQAQNEKMPVDPKIKIGVLSNGIKYYILENKKPEKRAELRLMVNAGSILENDDQKGLAHFVEHMAFNGSTHFKKNELINYLESVGVKFGPELNAYTSFDETVYMLQVPTDKEDIVDKGFLVLEDWASGLSFDSLEIDKERGVITEEWRLGRGADMRMFDKQLPILFKDSKYAERLTIGDINIIKNFKHETLKSFYRDWYRPDLYAVAAVGDFNKDDIEKLIKKHFEGIKSAASPRVRDYSEVPPHKETYYAIAADKEATASLVSLYITHPSEKVETINDYRENIIGGLFLNMLNSRLAELSILPDPPFVSASAGKGRFVRTVDAYSLGALVKESGIEKGLETLLRETERARKFGFLETELDRTKKNALRRLEKSFAERDKFESGSLINGMVSNYLNGSVIPGIEIQYELYKKLLPTIKLEDINKVAEQLLMKENRVVMVNTPEKEGVKLPTEETLQSVLNKVENEKIEPYVDKVKNVPLVKQLPKPGSVLACLKNDKIGYTEWKLSNGARVIIKSTDFKNDEIQMQAFSYGGLSQVEDNEYNSSMLATQIAVQSGLGEFNINELRKALTGKIANASPYISKNTEGFTGSCSPADAETMFQRIYLNFTNPRFDSSAFISYKAKLKAMLENARNEPEAVYQDTLQCVLSNYNLRNLPFTLETLDRIDLKTAEKTFRERFNDAGDFTFVFVGNIDTVKFKPLVLQYIGGLEGKNSGEKWIDRKVTNPAGIVERIVKKGIEPKSYVTVVMVKPFNWSRIEEYRLESLIDALNIRLREVIREDKGGTYGVGIREGVSKFPTSKYQITFNFGCNPERVDELSKAAFQVLDSMKQFGPSPEIVNKVKEIQMRTREVNLKKNDFWLRIIAAYLENQDNPDEILDYSKWNVNLKGDDIKAAAQKYLSDDNYVKVVLYPEIKK